MKRAGLTICLVAATMWVGCNEHHLTTPPISAEQSDRFVRQRMAVDVLWVVDDSNSMCEEQEALQRDFGSFVRALSRTGLDFQLAVVTTDAINPRRAGRFVRTHNTASQCQNPLGIPDCPNDGPAVLRSVDYQRADGSLDEARLQRDFGCRASVGTSGHGLEQGLDAMALGLTGPDAAAFLRPDAMLAVFFLSDENDCSHPEDTIRLSSSTACEWSPQALTPTASYVELLMDLKADPTRIIVGGIVAPDNGQRPSPGTPLEPSCASEHTGEGYSGHRYQDVAEAFGDNNIHNICQRSYERSLGLLAYKILDATRRPCVMAEPVRCQSDGDCHGERACVPMGQERLCEGFVQVELQRDAPLQGRQCQPTGPNLQRHACVLEHGQDYALETQADTCQTGLRVNLLHPVAQDDVVVLRYPRDVPTERSAPSTTGQRNGTLTR